MALSGHHGVCPESWAHKPGLLCPRIRRSVSSVRSARPSRKYSVVPVGEMSRMEPRWQPVHVKADRRMSRAARASRIAANISGRLDDILRDAPALIPFDAPPVILTGEYIPENLLLSSEAGNWWLSDSSTSAMCSRDGANTICWAEHIYDRRTAAPGSKSVRGVWIFAGRYRFHIEAPADGASSASSRQRSRQAHLHRGLAATRRVTCSNCRNCSGRCDGKGWILRGELAGVA